MYTFTSPAKRKYTVTLLPCFYMSDTNSKFCWGNYQWGNYLYSYILNIRYRLIFSAQTPSKTRPGSGHKTIGAPQEVGGGERYISTISLVPRPRAERGSRVESGQRLIHDSTMDREETSGWDSVPYSTSPVSGMNQISQMVSVMQRYSTIRIFPR